MHFCNGFSFTRGRNKVFVKGLKPIVIVRVTQDFRGKFSLRLIKVQDGRDFCRSTELLLCGKLSNLLSHLRRNFFYSRLNFMALSETFNSEVFLFLFMNSK